MVGYAVEMLEQTADRGEVEDYLESRQSGGAVQWNLERQRNERHLPKVAGSRRRCQ